MGGDAGALHFRSGPAYRTFAGNRSLRLPGFDYASPHVYFVTVGVLGKRKLLAEGRYAGAVLGCLRRCRERHGYVVYAYCLMPDHSHLLVMPRDSNVGLASFVGAFTSLSTRAYWKQGGTGRPWQQHYYDHIVRSEESLSAVAEYILDNPVRGGLVSGREEYAFCGIIDEIPV